MHKHQGRPKNTCSVVLIQHIKSIAPMTMITPSTDTSDTHHLSCLKVFSQPVELPCRAVVCAACIISWLTLSASSQCPCCYSETPLDPAHINPAPSLILELLGGILVSCSTCKADVMAGSLCRHQCCPQSSTVSKDELQATSSVIQQLLSGSPENVVELPTRGTVSDIHINLAPIIILIYHF